LRAFRALISLGGLLVIIGIYLVLPATAVSNTETDTIPAGGNYFFRITFSVQKAGQISGTYSETAGNSVTLFVFNNVQLDAYRTGDNSSRMFVTSGSSGSYSASVFSPGDYYLVLQHGSAYSAQSQNVQLTWTLDGMNLVWLGIGVSVLIVGVALSSLGYLKRRGALPPPSATDVIMFNQPKPPEQPPPTQSP
jgi:hypothetical protein